MATPRTLPPELREFDLSGLGFWTRPDAHRLEAFRRMREMEGAAFVPIAKLPFIASKPGFHALARHADVTEASRRPELFSSEPTANTLTEMPAWAGRFFGSMINMDDPRHAQIRRVVSRAFSPKILARAEEDLQRRAARIVDDMIAEGPRDFVAQAAARLPVEVICDLMGIPERHHGMVLNRTNVILGYSDPEYNGIKADERYMNGDPRRLDVLKGAVRLVRAGRDLSRLVKRLGEERRKRPGDDLISRLVNANDDGESLTAQETGSFFILLVTAGNETTRNAIAHALRLFTEFPEQRRLLAEDFEGRIAGAVEEIVRYSCPVIQFRRNVTRDCELNGIPLKKGDIAVLIYTSANRDESVFTDPDAFDITRSPNPHVGFGGPGPHYCLGAHLARREITVMLRELFTRLPDIRSEGEPDRLLSHFINGVKRMPYTFTPPVQDPS
ncbi:cytochrome P450 [Actinomadura rugatobispora]|uniref:Cytochrome P450 n=1 Tax=Actinomadura rugatobispora TaxID=1994 RepID=A0ABW1AI98_9ACTN|nr:methyl-branched lipid omega-hydroxylase Cyp124 [Actinomadura rugatobispora]